MNGVPISICSITQKFMMLSVTEVKIAAGVIVAQDMLCVYHLMESLELEFELPMVLNMDNSSAVDIANSWSVGGRECITLMCAITFCANSKTRGY